jgi:hypothetical protein
MDSRVELSFGYQDGCDVESPLTRFGPVDLLPRFKRGTAALELHDCGASLLAAILLDAKRPAILELNGFRRVSLSVG